MLCNSFYLLDIITNRIVNARTRYKKSNVILSIAELNIQVFLMQRRYSTVDNFHLKNYFKRLNSCNLSKAIKSISGAVPNSGRLSPVPILRLSFVKPHFIKK